MEGLATKEGAALATANQMGLAHLNPVLVGLVVLPQVGRPEEGLEGDIGATSRGKGPVGTMIVMRNGHDIRCMAFFRPFFYPQGIRHLVVSNLTYQARAV